MRSNCAGKARSQLSTLRPERHAGRLVSSSPPPHPANIARNATRRIDVTWGMRSVCLLLDVSRDSSLARWTLSTEHLLSSMFVMLNSIGYHVSMVARLTKRSFAFFAALTGMTALAPSADANGRFPRAQSLKEISGDSNRLILSATYGLLATNDRGKNWYLACERSLFGDIPAMGDEIDPLLEVTPSGAILSGSFHGLRVSRDGACTFATEMALPVDPSFPSTGKPNDKGTVQDITLEGAKGNKAAIALVVKPGATASMPIFQ